MILQDTTAAMEKRLSHMNIISHIKGTVHPKTKILSLWSRPEADGRSVDVSQSTKRFISFTAKQSCSLRNWSRFQCPPLVVKLVQLQCEDLCLETGIQNLFSTKPPNAKFNIFRETTKHVSFRSGSTVWLFTWDSLFVWVTFYRIIIWISAVVTLLLKCETERSLPLDFQSLATCDVYQRISPMNHRNYKINQVVIDWCDMKW